MKTHPAADAARVTEAFVSAASGNHDSSKREPGVSLTRHDLRQAIAFAEDGQSLPTGALSMESHLGYRFCNIPGTEPPEVLTLYSEIRAHAGTWAFHQQQCKERCEALLFEARNLVDDTHQVIDALAAGTPEGLEVDSLRALLDGARARASKQASKANDASKGLIEFQQVIQTSLAARIEEKLQLIVGGVHDTEVFGQRAVIRRQRKAILDLERAYGRVVDADGFNLLGRRIARTVFAEAAVAAHDELFNAVFEFKKTIGQVAIPHRLLKSLGARRVQLANAALAARSGAQALGHLATIWATTAGAYEDVLATWDAAKTPADRAAVSAKLEALAAAWDKVESLSEANDAVFG